MTILRRILAYGRKVLGWETSLDAIRGSRRRPQIATRTVVRAVAAMFLSRRGSLHALGQTRPSAFWSRWLGQDLPSADSVGRVCSRIDVSDARASVRQGYSRLKRMKALEPPGHGLMLAVVNGHETTASRKRCCPESCRRVWMSPPGIGDADVGIPTASPVGPIWPRRCGSPEAWRLGRFDGNWTSKRRN